MNVNDIALTLENGVGAKTAAALLGKFGSADAVYAASAGELERAGLRRTLALQLVRKEYHRQAEKELKYIEKHGITALASTDGEYPPLMREMNDYPHVIYVQGDIETLRYRCVAMVGTRQITSYGQTMCERLVGWLSERVPGLCIVSGLAFGIDASCHRAALRHGVPTVAVIANTLPDIVPASNSGLGRDILARGGAIVTECHSGSKQTGDFYLARNRIIAGMSEGTVVVEGDYDSGAVTTGEMAFGYNRTLMAVPGRATDKTSGGPNMLIKTNKAQAVCSGEDIVRAFMWDLTEQDVGPRPSLAVETISGDAAGLLGCFRSGEAISVDGLSEVTALEYSALAPMLLELEFAGKIKREPGGMYIKIS